LLYSEYAISKSTGSICKQLNIFSVNETGTYNWLSDKEPNREMALQILEQLRRRNDKMVIVPLAGFEALVDTLGELVNGLNRVEISGDSEPVRIDVNPKNKMLSRALNQAEMGNNTLFTESDKKHDERVGIIKTIAGSLFTGRVLGDLDKQTVVALNDWAVYISDELLIKIYDHAKA
jgi:hypothetical protein